MSVRHDIAIVGGVHDGLLGTVPTEVLELGFVIEASTAKKSATMFIYFLAGRDVFGRYVFSPPSLVSPAQRRRGVLLKTEHAFR